MLNFIQFFTGILLIIIIAPQTPTENVVLNKLLETGFFTGYNEATFFLKATTWILIFIFLFFTFLLYYT